MLVKELIEALKLADPEDIVILSSDSEGNDYRELDDYNETDYYWLDGDIYNDTVEGHKAFVLWPAGVVRS